MVIWLSGEIPTGHHFTQLWIAEFQFSVLIYQFLLLSKVYCQPVRQYDEFWKIQRQNLCQRSNRQNVCSCSRTGRRRKRACGRSVGFLHDPNKYAAIGATLPKGALLVGPPGTGKTLLAQAVAGEVLSPSFLFPDQNLWRCSLVWALLRFVTYSNRLRKKLPASYLLMRFDTIGKKRDGAGVYGGNDEREQTLASSWRRWDGFDSAKGVVILAATNRRKL